MAFDKKLLDILACPTCKGGLIFAEKSQQLVCAFDKVAYPINEGIPVLLENEAITLTSDQVDAFKK